MTDDELIVLRMDSQMCSYSMLVWVGYLLVGSVLETGRKRFRLQVSLLKSLRSVQGRIAVLVLELMVASMNRIVL